MHNRLQAESFEGSIDGKGVKFDVIDNKLRYDLVPPQVEDIIALVCTVGAMKYADNNWLRGMPWSKCYAAIRRHLSAFYQGVDLDEETKLWHLGQAAWGALALLYYAITPGYEKFDDRVFKTANRTDFKGIIDKAIANKKERLNNANEEKKEDRVPQEGVEEGGSRRCC